MLLLKTELLDELVRQLLESADFLDFLRATQEDVPFVYGLELAADRLRDLAGELDESR